MAQKVGEIDCAECGAVATLHSMRKGNGYYLYSNCPKCKVDQRTGAPVQARLFESARWAPGQEPIKPPNVTAADWSPESKSAPKSELASLPKAAEDRPASAPAKKGGKSLIFGVCSVLALVVGAVALLKGRRGRQPEPMGVYHAGW